MSDQARAFPERPSLRFLKLAAKHRLTRGEFTTLHEAQLAIAREHGLPSWTALKEFVTAQPSEPNPALTQVCWLISRFQGADDPAWVPPGPEELREHFADHFLSLVTPDTLVSTLIRTAPALREELVVTREMPPGLQAQIGGLKLEAAAEADPPHRLAGLRMFRIGEHVTDPRVAAPPDRSHGTVPAGAAAVVAESVAELGLPGLALAGGSPPATGGDPVWLLARGWASLDPAEALGPGHRFPAYSITKLITATVILLLAARGRLTLDDPASQHLRTVRLADDAVTIRQLLSHTGGVASPEQMFGTGIPELVTVTGPVVACGGPRGTFSYSNGGYAVLGQLIADVTGAGYQDVAADLVLRPLGMSSSSFPAGWPDRDAVTGYQLAEGGSFEPVPARVCLVPAAGGLWATAADLVRFGLGWASLLPPGLAREALRPHADRDPAGARIGLGWLLNEPKDVAGHAGGGPGAATSLITVLSTGQVSVAMANRLVPIEPVSARLLRPIA